MQNFMNSIKCKLFDIRRKNAAFRCEEDKKFYENQKLDRKFTIGTLDKNDSRKINENFYRRARDTRKRKTDEPMYIFDSLDEDAGNTTIGPPRVTMSG